MHRVLLNSPSHNEPADVFEEDCGLIDTDEKSPDDSDQRFPSDDAPSNCSASTYPLLVPLEQPNPFHSNQNSDAAVQRIIESTTGILSSQSGMISPFLPYSSRREKGDANNVSSRPISKQHQNNAASEDAKQNSHPDQNILQLIGDGNAVVRTVKLIHNLRRHRQEVLTLLISKSERANYTVAKPQPIIPTGQIPTTDSSARTDNVSSHNIQDRATRQSCNESDAKLDRTQDGKSDDLLEIRNEVDEPVPKPLDNSSTRETTIMRGVCALILSLSGFSDCSQNALDILVDLLIYFIQSIGRKLVLITDEGQTGVVPFNEQLRVVGESGFRGNLPDLVSYITMELVKTEQAALEAKARLQKHLDVVKQAAGVANDQTSKQEQITPPTHNSIEQNDICNNKDIDTEMNVATTERRTERNSVDLSSEAFAFGYLNKRVRLDVLGGIQVPLPLAYDETGHLSMGDTTSNDGTRAGDIPAQALGTTKVKAGTQLEDVNRWMGDMF